MQGESQHIGEGAPRAHLKGSHIVGVREKLILFFPILLSASGIILGCVSLSKNALGNLNYVIPALFSIIMSSFILLLYTRLTEHVWQWKLVILGGLGILAVFILYMMPSEVFGLRINGSFHRSFFAAILLLSLSIPTLCFSIYYIAGATPHSQDLAVYPVIILPIILTLLVYGLLVFKLIEAGVPGLSWEAITTAYMSHMWSVRSWQDDWPVTITYFINQTGISQFILGTFLLMLMTTVIAVPIGMGIGLFVTQYSSGKLADIIKFATSSLRAISVFVLGLTAFSIVKYSGQTPLSELFCGFYMMENGEIVTGTGSFITASLVISLLVIPVIASSVEEGIRSLPKDLTEGSLAIGASHTYTISHLLVPWVLPNLVTGILIGCAEAAGSLATIMFISGTAEHGVTPFSQPTSLTYFIWKCMNDQSQSFRANEGPYEFAAALLLIMITLGLGISALLLKRHFSKHFRGAA
ncbi:MAG: ABC transporter permease subunit [Dehalococcoidales bacterium]|nr:ABC transporter permease subunit [Dehalococcoidales bacterium]